MAIPQGRLSTDWSGTAGTFVEPEDRVFRALVSYEKGPVAIQDPTQGMRYQTWVFDWDPITGDVTATPETTGVPVVVYNIPACTLFSCTFDQNGRVNIAFMNGNGFLWWYDSVPAQKVLTDLGSDIYSVALTLDDKRNTQNAKNDMLLWYTKDNGGSFDLYMLLQRERFQTEYLMASALSMGHLHNVGMNQYLRNQLLLKSHIG